MKRHDEVMDDESRRSQARVFLQQPLLQTHSGIYPSGAVKRAPVLNERGEYDDPPVRDGYEEDVATIAALGPLRVSEGEIARDLFSMEDGAILHSDLGWYVGLYTGYVEDEEQRLNSSSGGIATALLTALLDRGDIDGVIHMLPGRDGTLFEYRISRDHESIVAGAKTRYYPGSLYASLEEVRRLPGRYAIVGIPSFISEIRRLERLEPDLASRIVFHIGLICGHQKTANYAANLAWQEGIDPKRIETIDFRVKNSLRPANDYSTRLVHRNQNDEVIEKVVPQSCLFGTNWGWSMFKSYFSDLSRDAFNETADIVLGDAWLPRFTSDYRGTNVIIVRNNETLSLLRDLNKSGIISLEASSETEVFSSQAGLVRHMRNEVDYRQRCLEKAGMPVDPIHSQPSPPRHLPMMRKILQRRRLKIALRSHGAFVSAQETGDYNAFRREMKWDVFVYRIANKIQQVSNRLRSVLRK